MTERITRPRTVTGQDTPEDGQGGGRPTTRAFTRRPMPGALDGPPPPSKPGAASEADTPPPPLPVAPRSGGRRSVAGMPAVGDAPAPPVPAPGATIGGKPARTTAAMSAVPPLPVATNSNPALRSTAQMPAVRPPGLATTAAMPAVADEPAPKPFARRAMPSAEQPALPPAPPPAAPAEPLDAETLIKSRSAMLRSEAEATQGPRTRRPASLAEAPPAFAPGPGGWTADLAPSNVPAPFAGAPPPVGKKGLPRYWTSTITYVVLIGVVGSFSAWVCVFLYRTSHPVIAHDVAHCDWLPSTASHISYRETPLARAAVFVIAEDDFLRWAKASQFHDLGLEHAGGIYVPSTDHQLTVTISPDEVVRGDATNGYWYENRSGTGAGYTVAYDASTGHGFYTLTRTLW